ncbi:hypothetical protein [Mucilaginibacter ginsenosidivorans]|uniref:Holliday junction resolvase RuvC n=1 Tax=Mucilaginibacter ginsenosidivorans TaxID=398053 RepID=A0A5B8URZ8_9SPHI|nr:hypothetical protein [Mucilaginibacter ginsenosidivorans]QEC61729.1 hypothetical protein FRZ54_03730 [Mucilaginibacter ginsenosidivorans]
MVILGISIGTRTSGIAIINKRGLIEWRTLSFKNPWSAQKADVIVSSYEHYIKRHRVTVVALKIPPLTHQTTAIMMLLEKLVALFTYHGCMVEYKTKKELKGAVPHARNTRQLLEHAALLYPMIVPKVSKELTNRNKYHHKMAEAVLVAHHSRYRDSVTPG